MPATFRPCVEVNDPRVDETLSRPTSCQNIQRFIQPQTRFAAYPAFLQFWVARLASGFGFQMLSVAVGWQIYALTGRALDLGLVGLVQFVPSLLLALPAGHIADQFNRRRIVVLCQALEWIAVVLLALGSALHWLDEVQILLLIFLIGVGKAIEFPTRVSMVPGSFRNVCWRARWR